MIREFSHEYWMHYAVELAKKSENEVPVAALVVSNNVLISQAVNKVEEYKDSTLHAEIIAIREASKSLSDWRLNDCILYTTLEPCAMCMGAILNSRISKLVFGAYDLNAGTCGSCTDLISSLNKENQIEIIGGILELESSSLLKTFFALRR